MAIFILTFYGVLGKITKVPDMCNTGKNRKIWNLVIDIIWENW